MLIRISLFLVVIFSIGVLEQGCYYDNEEDLFGVGAVDTCDVMVGVSYSVDLVPILDLNCNNACHSSTIRKENVVLDSYTSLMFYVDNGELIGTINHESGFSAMPPGIKLETCEIALFEKWLEEGAPDN